MFNRSLRLFFWLIAIVLVLTTTSLLWYYAQPRRHHHIAYAASPKDAENPEEDEDHPPLTPDATNVQVIQPRHGAMERITVQVGSVQAFESVHLHAKVSGYLKSQSVDIGDRVKRGQVLAVVDVPEVEKQLERNAAAVELSRARVQQMRAKVSIATADLEAVKAQIVQAEANAKASTAWVGFRSKQYERMKELFNLKSIDERLVDETKERYQAAIESENSSKASILTNKALAMSAAAKIVLARADVDEAEAQVKVSQAEYEKIQVQLAYASIIAPFNGMITQRTLSPGDFVRSAGEGGNAQSLLTIQRTDRMRVIVQIPDRDVPFVDPGDSAMIELDAFPGEKFPAKVSRIAQSEDAQTRLMPVEIDIPNPIGKIRQGMFGRVMIILDKATDQLSVPSYCLAGKSANGKGAVFVVRDGKAHLTKIKLGADNGVRVEVLSGLKTADKVIYQPSTSLPDGIEVQSTLIDETEMKSEPQP